jgi:hypothetical protein
MQSSEAIRRVLLNDAHARKRAHESTKGTGVGLGGGGERVERHRPIAQRVGDAQAHCRAQHLPSDESHGHVDQGLLGRILPLELLASRSCHGTLLDPRVSSESPLVA